MKRTALLRVMVVLLVLMGLAGALLRWALARPDDDGKELALNLGTELIGAALTYTLFELVIGRMEKREEKREAEKKEREAEKADLIAQMGSQVPGEAIRAAEELARHGWLYGDSLQGVDLAGAKLPGIYLDHANLQGANLAGANLQGATLTRANLQGATLHWANLQEAILFGAKLQGATLLEASLQGGRLLKANLQGATLAGANLQGATLAGANLQEAKFDDNTTLPDGTKWTPGTDIARFTDITHPDFWRPEESS